jgi:hypothetical protein
VMARSPRSVSDSGKSPRPSSHAARLAAAWWGEPQVSLGDVHDQCDRLVRDRLADHPPGGVVCSSKHETFSRHGRTRRIHDVFGLLARGDVPMGARRSVVCR